MFLQHLIYQIKRPYHFFKTGLLEALPAQIKYRFPERKLKIIAISGTDGKTTSCSLLYHLLKQAGKKVALVSTVAAYINDQEIDTGFHVTSPAPADLYRFMRQAVDQGAEYFIVEYTSQGAYQFRLFGLKPQIAGITNINRDHFDYHLNYNNYLAAKARILQKSAVVVLNEDDQSFYRLRKLLPSTQHLVLTYNDQEKLNPVIKTAINQRFPEAFNQMNARLVEKIASYLKIKPQLIAQSIGSFPGVRGRMQFLDLKQLTGKQHPFQVVVDFAHTPQGLTEALTALRQTMKQEHLTGRLIVIHGAAGLRDKAKRPLMGQISSKLADLVVLTAEDPRTENVWSIIRQMKEDLNNNYRKVISIADRQQAINFTLQKLAKKGDLVALLGKGPEQSMAYGHTEHPWDEVKAVQKALG